MVARVCLCLYMLSTLGMPWCLEQPASSVLERHPLFQFLCERFLVYKIHVYMGAYGAKSHKPSWIYGNKRYILDQLDLPLDRTAVERFELPFGPCRSRQYDAKMVDRRELLMAAGFVPFRYEDSSGEYRVKGGQDLKGGLVPPSNVNNYA